ncbi:MAG: phospholipase D family protein [Verrucomicrobia bacterium]|nr:phospholipase D family protein [Verrucomicrobiota bacterium]
MAAVFAGLLTLSIADARVHADDLLDQLRARQREQAQSAPNQPLASGQQQPATSAMPPISVYFSPNGGCTAAVVRELGNARSSVLIEAYSFTSKPIAQALIAAQRRGAKVEAVLDYSNKTEPYSEAGLLARSGVATYLDGRYKIAHSKVMVIDGAVVITGSFNFTHSAEADNKENLLVIRDRGIAAIYTAEWQRQRPGVEPYGGR